jgi:hypothetical protein
LDLPGAEDLFGLDAHRDPATSHFLDPEVEPGCPCRSRISAVAAEANLERATVLPGRFLQDDRIPVNRKEAAETCPQNTHLFSDARPLTIATRQLTQYDAAAAGGE